MAGILTAAGVRVAVGAVSSAAPSPSAGIGARPVSMAALAPGFGTLPGCAAAWSGAGATTRASDVPLRLPNTSVSELFLEFDHIRQGRTRALSLFLSQFGEQRH